MENDRRRINFDKTFERNNYSTPRIDKELAYEYFDTFIRKRSISGQIVCRIMDQVKNGPILLLK